MTNKKDYRSKTSTVRRNMTGAKALWRATGMKKEDAEKIKGEQLHCLP